MVDIYVTGPPDGVGDEQLPHQGPVVLPDVEAIQDQFVVGVPAAKGPHNECFDENVEDERGRRLHCDHHSPVVAIDFDWHVEESVVIDYIVNSVRRSWWRLSRQDSLVPSFWWW